MTKNRTHFGNTAAKAMRNDNWLQRKVQLADLRNTLTLTHIQTPTPKVLLDWLKTFCFGAIAVEHSCKLRGEGWQVLAVTLRSAVGRQMCMPLKWGLRTGATLYLKCFDQFQNFSSYLSVDRNRNFYAEKFTFYRHTHDIEVTV